MILCSHNVLCDSLSFWMFIKIAILPCAPFQQIRFWHFNFLGCPGAWWLQPRPPCQQWWGDRFVGANKRWRSSPTSAEPVERFRRTKWWRSRTRSPSCVSVYVCVRLQISLFSGLSLPPSFYYRVARTQSSACPAGSLSSSQDSGSGVLACFPARQFEPAGSPVLCRQAPEPKLRGTRPTGSRAWAPGCRWQELVNVRHPQAVNRGRTFTEGS